MKRPSRRLLTVALSGLLTLGLAELAARIAVQDRWSPRRVEALTTHGFVRGRVRSDDALPYVLTPSTFAHNALGYRGRELPPQKAPGTLRIGCVGASTTYGWYVTPEEAYPAQLEKLLTARGVACEVLNAGVPGWTSVESLLNLERNLLPLEPDLIVVYQGRNDVFPQCFNEFRPDYSHFRDPEYRMEASNYWHKSLFRASHLAMILCTWRGGRFGWSVREENPSYGSVRFENRPTPAEVVANLADPARGETYRRALEQLIAACQREGVAVVCCTMAFDARRLVSGILLRDESISGALQERVEENNRIVREVCSAHGVPVAETARLADEPELFRDDCHARPAGHARRAEIILETLAAARLVDGF